MNYQIDHFNYLSHLIPRSKSVSQKIWYSNPKPHTQILKNRESQTMKQISFPDPPRIGSMRLSTDLYLLLSKLAIQCKLSLNLPETIIYGHGFHTPTYLFTNSKGYLCVKSKLNPLQLETIYKIFEFHRQCSKKSFATPLAIVKSPISSCSRVIMKASEFLNEVKTGFKSDIVIQRYIIPKGNKALKIRQFCSDSKFSYFNITNKLRLDGKQDYKPKPKPKQEKILPRNVSFVSESNTIDRRSFIFVPENGLTSEYEDKTVLDTGKKYLNDRYTAKGLMELGSFEINEKFIKRPRLKTYEPVAVNARRQTPVTAHQMNELDKYLEDTWASSMNIEQSLEDLYKELDSLGTVGNFEYANKEDMPISIFVINRLRNLFVIDTTVADRFNAFEVIGNSFAAVEKWSSMLRNTINTFFFAKNGETVEDLVLDFCEDFTGNFYFLKIKSFVVKAHTLVGKPAAVYEKEFKCPGKYCNKGFVSDDFSESVESSGFKPKVFKILMKTLKEKDERDIQVLLKTNFEQVVEVCQKCFEEYMKIEQNKVKVKKKSEGLIDVSKFRFAQATGKLKTQDLRTVSQVFKKQEKKPGVPLKFTKRKKELELASKESEFINN